MAEHFKKKPDMNVTEVNSVTLIMTLLSPGGRFSVELFSFFLIFFFSFLISTRLSRQKIPTASRGSDLSCSHTKSNPGRLLNVRHFLPIKEGLGKKVIISEGGPLVGV